MAKAPTRVALGRIYEDEITGFLGAATARHTSKNGCVQVALKPRVVEEGKMPKSEYIFESQLVDKETGVKVDSKPEARSLKLLGKHYTDTKTDFTGYACAHTELLNGTEQLAIEAKVKPDGTVGETWSIDVQDLTEVKTGKATAAKPERGAPNVRVERS